MPQARGSSSDRTPRSPNRSRCRRCPTRSGAPTTTVRPGTPEQSIPLAAALPAASGGRTAVHEGDRADLVLLGADPATVPASDLAQVPVLATLLAGRFTHRADA